MSLTRGALYRYQLNKNLISEKHQDAPIRIIYYSGNFIPVIGGSGDYYAKNINDAFELALKDIHHNIESSGNEVLVLGRINSDIDLIIGNDNVTVKKISGEKKIIHKLYPDLNIIFRTVHSSKGLEADQVIVLNLLNDKLGFPSQIINDPIISLLQRNEEFFLYAEERRLFYVALTRTKNCTYLLSPEINESIFVKDIEQIKQPNEVAILQPENAVSQSVGSRPTLQFCPICKTGILSVKKTNTGRNFVSCSNYPKCDYTLWDLNAARNNIRCPDCGDFLVQRKGKYGFFLGCSGYPGCTYAQDFNKKK